MRMKIGSNKCMSKGGIGIVHLDLYIDLGSKANELILANGNRWKGANSGEAQVLFVLDGEVIAEPTAKKDFKLERSVVVSFEQDKVSFFDFGAGTGGYYERVRR